MLSESDLVATQRQQQQRTDFQTFSVASSVVKRWRCERLCYRRVISSQRNDKELDELSIRSVIMKYIHPTDDSFQMLEKEVSDEMDGLSSSFTTQHTVYRRLIREYEDENMRLRNEYKHHFPRDTSTKKHDEDIENLTPPYAAP